MLIKPSHPHATLADPSFLNPADIWPRFQPPTHLLAQFRHLLIAVQLSDRIRDSVYHVIPGEGFVYWPAGAPTLPKHGTTTRCCSKSRQRTPQLGNRASSGDLRTSRAVSSWLACNTKEMTARAQQARFGFGAPNDLQKRFPQSGVGPLRVEIL
jgi:hypothetical protein